MKDYLVDALMKCLNEDGLYSVEEITHKTIFLEQDMPITFLLTAEDVAKYNMRKKYIEEAHLSSLQYMALANCKSALPKKIIKPRFPAIKKVHFNDPVTVVLWTDGTKTIVRAENEEYDPEKGLAMAIAKKTLGNKGSYYKTFKKWLPEAVVDEDNAAKEAVKAIRKLGQIVGQGLRDGLSGCGEEKEDENNDSN